MALKAGGSAGYFTTADGVKAIRYAADNGAKVINMSFGSSSTSTLEKNAVDYAYGKGVILFASAMNDATPTLMYPASYSNVVSIGATTNLDTSATFTNYNNMVDLSAPGVNIFSTMPTYLVGANSGGSGKALNYDFMSGTSMASPIAAGAAALIRGHNPSLSPLAVEKLLKDWSVDLGDPGWDDYFGEGRVNLALALSNTPAFKTGENGLYKTIAGLLLLVFGAAIIARKN